MYAENWEVRDFFDNFSLLIQSNCLWKKPKYKYFFKYYYIDWTIYNRIIFMSLVSKAKHHSPLSSCEVEIILSLFYTNW